MINKILITENRILKGLRIINEQDSEEYYKISPEEYQELMEFASYNGNAVTKLKKFGGKPLWITGYVSLRNTPTVSLGNVARIEGGLDISKTKIKSLGNLTTIFGNADFSNSEVENLENLTMIGGYADFQGSKIKDLGNLTTIRGTTIFGDRTDLRAEWEKRKNK